MLVLTLSFPTHKSVLKHNIYLPVCHFDIGKIVPITEMFHSRYMTIVHYVNHETPGIGHSLYQL